MAASMIHVGSTLSGTEFRKMDPLSLKNMIYKEVNVCAAEDNQYRGWIFTIDPVSFGIILADCNDVPPDGKVSVTLVMGQSISSITVLDEDTTKHKTLLDQLFKHGTHAQNLSQAELSSKKLKLKEWLEQHRVPVQECGEENNSLSISGVLVIEPPYKEDNCLCKNEIILARVQALIRNMKDT